MKRENKTDNVTQNEGPEIRKPDQTWIDHIAGISFRFERFGRDILSVGLIVFTLATFLGVTKLTRGSLIDPWSEFVQLWLGWGVYPTLMFLLFLSLSLLRRSRYESPVVTLFRILAIEGWIFSFMGILSIAGGHSLERAESGLDGGVIGWGLVRIFGSRIPVQFISLLLITALLYFTLVAFGGVQKIRNYLVALNDQKTKISGLKDDLRSKPLDQRVVQTPKQSAAAAGHQMTQNQLVKRDNQLPPLNLLTNEEVVRPDREDIHATAELIELTLTEFGIPARVTGYRVGPTVTQFAIEPGYVEKTESNGEVTRH